MSAEGGRPIAESAALPFGATVGEGGTYFRAFATECDACSVRLYDSEGQATSTYAMTRRGNGDFGVMVAGIGHGALYRFVLGDRELPDPYARYLPHGVHGPAMVTTSSFVWKHGAGVARPLEEQVLYEVHIGTFTREGTYEAARARLTELAELGVTTVEIMPIAAFPGSRGWGYDGVALYAPFAGYGTPDELRRFIDEAHRLGLGVFLDVVYNHFGPSGNYLAAYSSEYFTHDIQTAWGDAPDFANPAMRHYVLENARYWLTEFRFDGLRLDAIHAIVDPTPCSILRELSHMVSSLEPRKILVGEDERNDPDTMNVLGLDAVWADDFHHQVHVALTQERDGYYRGYEPGLGGIADTLSRGWLYEGEHYAPTGTSRGKRAEGLSAASFVYCIQNHDQVGNRALGERLSALASVDAYCAASTLLLLLPMTPLLFMGQEWAASTPFLYFTDHEEELGHAVSAGRREEFSSFSAFADPARRAEIPDPQARETFERSRLRWEERTEGEHTRVLDLYRELLRLRRTDRVFRHGSRERLHVEAKDGVLVVRQWLESDSRIVLVNFTGEDLPLPREWGDAPEALFTSGAHPRRDRLGAWTALVLKPEGGGPARAGAAT